MNADGGNWSNLLPIRLFITDDFQPRHVIKAGIAGHEGKAAAKRLRGQPGIVFAHTPRGTRLQQAAAQGIGHMQTEHGETRHQLARRFLAPFFIKFLNGDDAHENLAG